MIPNNNWPYGKLQYILHQLNLDWLVKQVNKNTEDIKELQEEGGTNVPDISASATVDANIGTPTVSVTRSGTDLYPNFEFAFKNLKGEKGDTGATGATGPQGEQGPQGIQGETGATGATGATGPQGPQGIQGEQGPQGETGATGATGAAGADGVSPEISITSITGGHTVTITDADHPSGQSFNVMDGEDGATGPQGPAGPAGADGADGADGVGVPTGGTAGQVLAKASGTDYDTEWVNQSGGGGGVDPDVIADAFGGSPSSYSAGDTCMYNSTRYECTGATGGTWDSSKWSQIIVDTVQSWGGAVESGHYIVYNGGYYKNTSNSSEWYSGGVPTSPFVLKTFPEYVAESTINYSVGDYVMYNDKLYRCTGSTTSTAWDSTKWTETQVTDEVGCEVPSGGTTGQVLSKRSNTNYDLEWTTPSGGGPTTVTLIENGSDSALNTSLYQSGEATWAPGYSSLLFDVLSTVSSQINLGTIDDSTLDTAGIALFINESLNTMTLGMYYVMYGSVSALKFNQAAQIESGEQIILL